MYASGFGSLASAVCLSAAPFDQAEAQTLPDTASPTTSASTDTAAADGAPPRAAATARALPPAQHKGGRAGGFQNIRSNDSFPRPAAADAPWQERAKHVALTGDGRIWVTFSGEERMLMQAFDRPSIGVAPTNSVLSYQFRHQYGADLHLGENLRVFGQIVSGQVTGDNYKSPIFGRQQNAAELGQAFVEYSHAVEGGRAGVIVGRQQTHLGSGPLVSAQAIHNIQRNFDGVRAYYAAKTFRFDAFAYRPLIHERGAFDDTTDDTTAIWGAYAAFALPRTTDTALNFDAYYVGYRDEESPLLRTTSIADSNFFGVRLHGQAYGAQIDTNWILQTGDVGPREIEAWSMISSLRYVVPDAPRNLTLSLVSDVASGGSREGDVIRTFDPLYGVQRHANFANSLGFTNFVDVGGGFSFDLTEKLEIGASLRAFWRYSIEDGYALGYSTAVNNRKTDARFIGVMPGLNARYALDKHVSLQGSISPLLTSDGYKAVGQDDMQSYQMELLYIW
jgi:hypothetical protein